MCLQSNVGKMLITHKTHVAIYKPHVWFDQKYITNFIALKNIIKQYRVTYDILMKCSLSTKKNMEITICT